MNNDTAHKPLKLQTPIAVLLIGAAALLILLIFAYGPALQRIPNGSEDTTMIDVGETQIVLNVWGTLHITGYPLYVMLSSALVGVLKAIGVAAAAAPALTSLTWGLIALALIYALMARTSRQPLTAAAIVVVFGVTRFVWLHMDIAEVYSFYLLLLAALLLIALWSRSELPKHPTAALYALALIGGIGIGHHRAIAMAIPALVYAAWPLIRAQGKYLPRTLVICLLLGLIGLLPYAYLVARAQAGAAWVYGEPGTLSGLWDQFMAREADHFIGGIRSLSDLWANFQMVTGVIVTDTTWIGVALGVIGLIIGVMQKQCRRIAITVILSGATAYLFHVFVYTDVLAPLMIAAELSLAFGWLFIAEKLFEPFDFGQLPVLPQEITLIGLAAFAAYGLISLHGPWINGLTSDPGAQQSIDLLEAVPPDDDTLMIAWGPRHFAAGFAHDVLGMRPDVTLVDHKRAVPALLSAGHLVTPDYTFYAFPLTWWEEQSGQTVYLSAAAPHLVTVSLTPPISQVRRAGHLPVMFRASLTCDGADWRLSVDWLAPADPVDRDYSVFVHVLDANGALIGQADESAPVYGWYPFTRWLPGQLVSDIYPLTPIDHTTGVTVDFGAYYQESSGAFVNVVEQTLPFPSTCPP